MQCSLMLCPQAAVLKPGAPQVLKRASSEAARMQGTTISACSSLPSATCMGTKKGAPLPVHDGGAGLVVLGLADPLRARKGRSACSTMTTCRHPTKTRRTICWKVESEARMEPPIQTEYLRSGGATTLTFMLLGARAVISLFMRSAMPGNMVVPASSMLESARHGSASLLIC